MPAIPIYLETAMEITVLLTVLLFARATKKPRRTILFLAVWILVQTLISTSGFYTVTNTLPPRLFFLLLPMVVFLLMLFNTKPGKHYVSQLDLHALNLLHLVRLPVELILLGLFLFKGIPRELTFEGRNFDVLSGVTAPVVYLLYRNGKLGDKSLLAWNIGCLLLLLNVVTHGILSMPYSFQQLAFEQPNQAMLYFPFVLLPACIVPLVLIAHISSIRILWKRIHTKRSVRNGKLKEQDFAASL